MESGQVKRVDENHVEVIVVSDFIAHNRQAVSKGDRVRLPNALARAMINIGSARELTAEESSPAPTPEATPAETIEVRDPAPTTREPRARKR